MASIKTTSKQRERIAESRITTYESGATQPPHTTYGGENRTNAAGGGGLVAAACFIPAGAVSDPGVSGLNRAVRVGPAARG